MLATPVVKNKVWIVENQGNRFGTIVSTCDGSKNVVLVTNETRTKYPSIKVLSQKHNIKFSNSTKKVKTLPTTVYGYSADGAVHNELFDVSKNLPVYTKSADSKSLFCAGYYIINFCGSWVKNHCPKLLTLERNLYHGPFYTEEQMKDALAVARKK
jgi:peroxiredoxin